MRSNNLTKAEQREWDDLIVAPAAAAAAARAAESNKKGNNGSPAGPKKPSAPQNKPLLKDHEFVQDPDGTWHELTDDGGPNNGPVGNYGNADPSQPWHFTSQQYSYMASSFAQGTQLLRQIAGDFPNMGSLNSPNANVASFSRTGNIGSFSPQGLGGLAMDYGNIAEAYPNDFSWHVQFTSVWSSDGLTFIQTATTLGDHPLVGTRGWVVSLDPSTLQLSYGTFAYEQPNGAINKFNFTFVGSSAQSAIWNTYFNNISTNYIPGGGVTRGVPVDTRVPVNPYYPGH